ncbi:MAG: hypothetical protein NUW01_00510 [Gemmatimonadaceae bacterium]|nr:hypothetical protein [Gemmatimonadaceae bacterium]
MARAAAYKRSNREKARAHGVVEYAVKVGKIVRPNTCDTCRAPSSHIHAHHPDYARPLAVRWLCPSCHKLAHIQKEAA